MESENVMSCTVGRCSAQHRIRADPPPTLNGFSLLSQNIAWISVLPELGESAGLSVLWERSDDGRGCEFSPETALHQSSADRLHREASGRQRLPSLGSVVHTQSPHKYSSQPAPNLEHRSGQPRVHWGHRQREVLCQMNRSTVGVL
ncbi:hypothetical protein AALO_G00288680 [Alosa alosa]|uniref:Uncharacterized protein n=1 Tax=Alosa alosa TaxID=278164 RepID=A0AAV6FG84_9TELE|nr:hypothetical protein AALO_G00288680 [Alosa alosa]